MLLLHPVSPHEQSTPHGLPVGAHSTQQYLPGDVTHDQTGWAEFLTLAGTITLLPTLDKERTVPAQMLVTR